MMCNQTFSSLLIKHWFQSMRRWLGRKNGFNYVLSQLENQSKSLNPLLGTLKFVPYSLSLTRYVFRWFHHRQQTNKLISIHSISLIRSISLINSRHFFSPEGRRVNHSIWLLDMLRASTRFNLWLINSIIGHTSSSK